MTLYDAKPGCYYRVEAISLPTPLKRRLHMLGMTKGTEVTVLRKKYRGAMIIRLRGVRYAVGAHLASGIFIERLDAQ